ncbi:unnamed protein product [Caenorhabditis angaria]|uniref:Uncharacterized protein n=1 Tax=Caenorhabditis angaria TaxID=860376 RepID=A0A9P1NCD3_9PELO|nr:unnamed protein product [Caenorhabditis angaria]
MANTYQAVANAKTTKERFSAFNSIFKGAAWTGFNYLLIFTIPIIFIGVGVWKVEECSLAPKFPIWLIVTGVLVVIERSISLIVQKKKNFVDAEFPHTENETEEETANRKSQRRAHYPTLLIFICFACQFVQMIWSFTGLFFVIRSFGAEGTCHWAPYWLTTLTVLLPWIFIMTLCPACCCACCVLASKAGKSSDGNAEQEATANA